jgi:hypothetical protein
MAWYALLFWDSICTRIRHHTTANMGDTSDALLNYPGIGGMGPGAVSMGVMAKEVDGIVQDGGGK